ncbi:MAG: type II toxin-antitoxin system PemK/MazF family toxin [Terriglobia bacterium]
MTNNPTPLRGEIWKAELGEPPVRHWVLVVSLDARNKSDRIDSVLIVPLGSTVMDGPTTMKLEPGETGLPAPSYLKGHFVSVLKKVRLVRRESRVLSQSRMREVSAMIRRAFDPDAPWGVR